ncbi:hypothetical protein I3760_02G063800 [Carya illinoinensis]|nr:hypothetical protein I3760_02G063800 [Carya illinoinensis]
MVRPKDPFWKYAENLKNGRFSCNFCHGQFAGGISRIKWHLSGHKSHDIKVCEQVPRDIRLAVQQVLDTPNKKDRKVDGENCSVPSSSGGHNLCKENDKDLMSQNDNNLLELNRAPNSSNGREKCQRLDKQLAKWFIIFGIDPEAIVSPIFKDFVKSIVEYGPSYQLPSTFTLKKELMLNVEKEVEEYVQNFINNPVQSGCTLMAYPSWQEADKICSVDIFGYSQIGAACLKSFRSELSCGGWQEIISSIIELISSTIELLGPNHVVQLLISGGISRRAIVLEIENRYPWICGNRCAVREIDIFNLRVEELMRFVKILVELIFSAYHHYNVSSRRRMKKSKMSSAFFLVMVKSVLEIEDELNQVVDPFSSMILSSNRVELLDEQEVAIHLRFAKLLDYIIGRKEFWSRVKAFAQVLSLLFQTKCLVNRDNSSIGYLYQTIESLRDGIEKSREYDYFVYFCIWGSFSNMRAKIIHPVHAAAAFLDPAFMFTDNFVETVEMIDGTNYILANMVDLNEKEAFTKDLIQYRMKMPMLFNAQAITMLNTCHPRK